MKKTKVAPPAIAAIALAALLGALAWTLSTQPLAPGAAPTGSAGSAPAMTEGSSRAGSSPVAAEDTGDGDSAPGEDDVNDKATEQAVAQDGGDGETGREEGGDSKRPASSKPAGGSSSSAGGSNSGGSSPSGGGSSSGGSASGGSGSASKPSKPSEPSKPSKPQHSHSWKAVYRDEPVYGQQWVSKWEDVFIKRQGRYTCNGCGAQFPSIDAHSAHADAMFDWDSMWYIDGKDHGGYVDDSYDIWEKRDNGSYQTVQTGTKKVLDHYECSCGARK